MVQSPAGGLEHAGRLALHQVDSLWARLSRTATGGGSSPPRSCTAVSATSASTWSPSGGSARRSRSTSAARATSGSIRLGPRGVGRRPHPVADDPGGRRLRRDLRDPRRNAHPRVAGDRSLGGNAMTLIIINLVSPSLRSGEHLDRRPRRRPDRRHPHDACLRALAQRACADGHLGVEGVAGSSQWRSQASRSPTARSAATRVTACGAVVRPERDEPHRVASRAPRSSSRPPRRSRRGVRGEP